MDTTQILLATTARGGNFATELSNRYTGCVTFLQ